MNPTEDNPPAKRRRSKGIGFTWQSLQERTELHQALADLGDEDPEVRRASAEKLARYACEEALLALRAANAVESIVACKAEIMHAIRALEEQLEPQTQTA